LNVHAPHRPGTSISVVVPVYSGQNYLAKLVQAVSAVRASLAETAGTIAIEELILVDDAARDGSPALVDALAADHPWVVALHMSRNFGQHAATVAGILHSTGDWVVTMDEDLQHPPEQIASMLHLAIAKGADVVYARPQGNRHGGMWRDASSKLFKRFVSTLVGDPNLPRYQSFRLIRGAVARAAAGKVGHDTYFDVLLSWFTVRVETLEMDLRDVRHAEEGSSGYSFGSLVGYASRMLFSGHLRVLRWFMPLGLGVMFLAGIGALTMVILRLVGPPDAYPIGWTSLAVLLTMFGGLIVLMLGVALQYLTTLVLSMHGKPNYFLIDRSKDKEIADALQLLQKA
jgi:glycosyltransferase involved in cell wall biosynthesis